MRIVEFGQVYNGKGLISEYADYVQFNISGLGSVEIVQKYFLYGIHKPIVLLGDYGSKERKSHQDDMLKSERIYDVKDAIKSLRAFGAEIIGLTMYPVTREGFMKFGNGRIEFSEYMNRISEILDLPVAVLNSSDEKCFLSDCEEIIDFSQTNLLALNCVSILDVCGYDKGVFIDTLDRIDKSNLREIHIQIFDTSNDCSGNETGGGKYNLKFNDVVKFIRKTDLITFAFEKAKVRKSFEESMREYISILNKDNES